MIMSTLPENSSTISQTPSGTCTICLYPYDNDKSFRLSCDCFFCRNCLVQLIKVNIEGRTIQRLKCPSIHKTNILRREVKKLVDNATYVKYIRLLHENSVLMDPSRSFCPQPECGAVCYSSVQPEAHAIRCVECGYKFCGSCKDRWPGSNHQCPEDVIAVTTEQPRAKGRPSRDSVQDESIAVELFEGDTMKGGTSSEERSDPTTRESTSESNKPEVKRCPRCRVPIEKREGCAHMRCARCGHNFCWFCLANLDNDYFLYHFESGPCRREMGHPRIDVHFYRFQAMCAICGVSLIAMICAPFAFLCSPFIVCCAPHFRCFRPNEDVNPHNVYENPDEYGDDTDDEADPE